MPFVEGFTFANRFVPRNDKIAELSREVTYQLLAQELATHYLKSYIDLLVKITQ